MRINLSEGEAHILILKALNLEGDATLKKRGNVHILSSAHEVNIIGNPPEVSKPGQTCGPNCTCTPPAVEDIDDEAFIVDGDKSYAEIAQMEEDLDGT